MSTKSRIPIKSTRETKPGVRTKKSVTLNKAKPAPDFRKLHSQWQEKLQDGLSKTKKPCTVPGEFVLARSGSNKHKTQSDEKDKRVTKKNVLEPRSLSLYQKSVKNPVDELSRKKSIHKKTTVKDSSEFELDPSSLARILGQEQGTKRAPQGTPTPSQDPCLRRKSIYDVIDQNMRERELQSGNNLYDMKCSMVHSARTPLRDLNNVLGAYSAVMTPRSNRKKSIYDVISENQLPSKSTLKTSERFKLFSSGSARKVTWSQKLSRTKSEADEDSALRQKLYMDDSEEEEEDHYHDESLLLKIKKAEEILEKQLFKPVASNLNRTYVTRPARYYAVTPADDASDLINSLLNNTEDSQYPQCFLPLLEEEEAVPDQYILPRITGVTRLADTPKPLLPSNDSISNLFDNLRLNPAQSAEGKHVSDASPTLPLTQKKRLDTTMNVMSPSDASIIVAGQLDEATGDPILDPVFHDTLSDDYDISFMTSPSALKQLGGLRAISTGHYNYNVKRKSKNRESINLMAFSPKLDNIGERSDDYDISFMTSPSALKQLGGLRAISTGHYNYNVKRKSKNRESINLMAFSPKLDNIGERSETTSMNALTHTADILEQTTERKSAELSGEVIKTETIIKLACDTCEASNQSSEVPALFSPNDNKMKISVGLLPDILPDSVYLSGNVDIPAFTPINHLQGSHLLATAQQHSATTSPRSLQVQSRHIASIYCIQNGLPDGHFQTLLSELDGGNPPSSGSALSDAHVCDTPFVKQSGGTITLCSRNNSPERAVFECVTDRNLDVSYNGHMHGIHLQSHIEPMLLPTTSSQNVIFAGSSACDMEETDIVISTANLDVMSSNTCTEKSDSSLPAPTVSQASLPQTLSPQIIMTHSINMPAVQVVTSNQANFTSPQLSISTALLSTFQVHLATPQVAILAPVSNPGSGCSVDTPEIFSTVKQKSSKTAASLSRGVFCRFDRYKDALLDDEVSLYMCRSLTSSVVERQRKLQDPVSVNLEDGDLMHFIPVQDVDQGVQKSIEGSAFHCFTP